MCEQARLNIIIAIKMGTKKDGVGKKKKLSKYN